MPKKIVTETVEYQVNGKSYSGFLAYDSASDRKMPGILIAPAWKGQDDFSREKAKELAEMGYAGFAIDVYGDAKQVSTNDEALSLMRPLFFDRQELLARAQGGFHTLSKHDAVDQGRLAVIGYCFGGLTALELFRSGIDVKAAVSLHGVLGYSLGEERANKLPLSDEIRGSLLILHGHNDPLMTQSDIDSLKTELSDNELDWQLHIFGNAAHAFTNPNANEPENGLQYQPIADSRSWLMMKNFFEEVLK